MLARGESHRADSDHTGPEYGAGPAVDQLAGCLEMALDGHSLVDSLPEAEGPDRLIDIGVHGRDVRQPRYARFDGEIRQSFREKPRRGIERDIHLGVLAG